MSLYHIGSSMSQKMPGETGHKKGSFAAMKRAQFMQESRVRYERLAPRITAMLFGLWTMGCVVLALMLPRASMWLVVFWIVGATVFGGAGFHVHRSSRSIGKQLSLDRNLADLYRMNPLDFEHAVARWFRGRGYEEVRVTPAMGDGGIDILMRKDGLRYGVQCKKYHPESFVKIDELRAFVYALGRAGCDRGIFVTTAQYGAHGRREMEEQGIELIDGRGLVG